MHDVTIIGLRMAKNPSPNTSGHTILAYFDCQIGGLELNGCALTMTPRGGWTVWPPKMEAAVRGPVRSIRFTSETLRKTLTTAAQASFEALRGQVIKRADDGEAEDLAEGLDRFLGAA